MSARPPVKTLFITLRRGFQGVPQTQRGVLKALGLTRRQQEIEKPNTASIRGAVAKVSHLVSVLTDAVHAEQAAAGAAASAPRPPLVIAHTTLPGTHRRPAA